MKSFMLCLCLSILVMGCKKEDKIGGTTRDINITIAYRNAANVDLLDPAVGGIYMPELVETYLLTETGQRRRVYDMLKRIKTGDSYFLQLAFLPQNDCWIEHTATLYLKYANGGEDVLKADFNTDKTNYFIITKLWVNGILAHEVSFNTGRVITFTK